jgi:hypothetical protein
LPKVEVCRVVRKMALHRGVKVPDLGNPKVRDGVSDAVGQYEYTGEDHDGAHQDDGGRAHELDHGMSPFRDVLAEQLWCPQGCDFRFEQIRVNDPLPCARRDMAAPRGEAAAALIGLDVLWRLATVATTLHASAHLGAQIDFSIAGTFASIMATIAAAGLVTDLVAIPISADVFARCR